MKKRDISLIIILVLILALLITNYIFYWFKGGYPVEITVSLIIPITLDLFAIWRMGMEDKKNDKIG